MKKTIHINMSGMAFTIEEDAYEKLNGYLKAVETKLGGGEEAKETIDDIESRIAELFAPVVQASGSAIRLEDVQEVIKVLGNPEDYLTDEEEEKNGSVKPPPVYYPKRLYRDPHSSVIGGVCSGLGVYFNIDPVVVRLLFVLGLIYGISILPYLILWIAIPKALTMEQRMMMYGGDLALSKGKQTPASMAYPQSSGLDGILRVAGIVLGIIILVGSFFSLVGLTIATLFSGTFISTFPETAWIGDIPGMVIGSSVSTAAFLGILLVVGIPLLMLFYLGLQLIFQFKKGGKVIGATGLVLWLIGIGLVIYAGARMATEFSKKEVVTQTELLEAFAGDTLYIKQAEMPEMIRGHHIMRCEGLKIWANEGHLSIEGRPTIEVINGANRFAITIEKSSRGGSLGDAAKNASAVEYVWVHNDSIILLDRIFTLAPGSFIRNQKVKITLEVPKDKEVKIDEGISSLVR